MTLVEKSTTLDCVFFFFGHSCMTWQSFVAEVPDIPATEIPDTIPVSSSTDWQAAFGFGQQNKNKDWQDDDRV